MLLNQLVCVNAASFVVATTCMARIRDGNTPGGEYEAESPRRVGDLSPGVTGVSRKGRLGRLSFPQQKSTDATLPIRDTRDHLDSTISRQQRCFWPLLRLVLDKRIYVR